MTKQLALRNSPANISRLLREDEVGLDQPIDLFVYSCDVCGFVQLTESLGETFYDDYVMTAKHSPQMQLLQAEQARAFVNHFALVGKRVIEVGCGDGSFLNHLEAAGALPFGIEPSARYRQHAKELGHDVHSGYVGERSLIPGAPYDAFVTRQVFEHVPDPNDFLLGIRRSLSPDGVGLVEVPSLEQAIDGGRFYDFFADHLNYYSERTLRFALEKNGFDVVTVERAMNGEYLLAYATVASDNDLSTIQRAVDLVSQDIQEYMKANRESGRTVAVWGSGGKGLASMAISRLTGIEYVIDSDPHKHGLMTPISRFPVVAPTHLQKDPVNSIILTALAYTDEILGQLRDIGFCGEVAILGNRLEVRRLGD